MQTKIADVMQSTVVTSDRGDSVGHVRQLMTREGISSVPVVSPDGEVVGIVTTSDLAEGHGDETPISELMGDHVYTVPAYNPVHIAARVMRNHHIHHVVVTHEKKVVGIVSSFDLLKLVEEHRFVMKNAPTQKEAGR